MFDEPGYDHQPNPLSTTPKPSSPTNTESEKSAAAPAATPPALGLQRPLWLRLSVYLLGLIAITRLCALTGEDALSILVQFGSVVVLALIIGGLMLMRRWAAWLFIVYCAWSIVSSFVVGIYRISLLDEEIQSLADRDGIIAATIFGIGFTFILYSALGVWFALRLREFAPLPLSARFGNIPYAIMVGVLVLFTATQIAISRDYLRLQQESLEDSRGFSQDVQKFFFGD